MKTTRDSNSPLVAANLTSIACDAPIRDKRSDYINGSIGFLAVTSLVVALRIFQRFYTGLGLYADDYLILFSYVLHPINSHLTLAIHVLWN